MAWLQSIDHSVSLILNQIFVEVSGRKDLISEFFRVEPHAASGGCLQCLQAIHRFDELSFFCLHPGRTFVFPK